MPEFLTTRGVTSKIEDIISKAEERVVLISPYLSYIPASFLMRIDKALKQNVKVALVFRKNSRVHDNELKKLQALNGLRIFVCQDLHAKAYFNEQEAVVTSFNISSSSETNNMEFGISFTRKDEPILFKRLVGEADLIFTHGELIDPNSDENPFTDDISGYCIRCKVEIALDISRPLCPSCFSKWDQWKNPSYGEKFCHICGSADGTSMAFPVCDRC